MSNQKTVAIVGSQSRTRALAPFGDTSTDIWVFNEAATQDWCKRADVVFQLHASGIYRSQHNRSDPGYWTWLRQPHDPLVIYLQEADPDVPSSRRYPLEEVVGTLLPAFRQGVERNSKKYFTNTIAYALALAIYEGYERIEIYGVEMGSDTEYQYQRACVLFWVGVGLGRGIAIDFVSGDEIFNVPLYGYEGVIESKPEDFTLRAEELRGIVSQLLDEKDKLEKQIRAGSPDGNLGNIITDLVKAYGALGDAEGRLSENERYAFKVIETIGSGGIAYIDRNEYESQAAAQKGLADKYNADVLKSTGAINYIMRAWTNNHDPTALEQIKVFTQHMCSSAYKAGRASGIFDENAIFVGRWDERIQAAGGSKAAEMVRNG